tara:strand:- start:206 stop:715 length:510 start_codon:yes stop_codon:yes gene_type:complete
MRFLIIFIFLWSNSFAEEITDIKNIVINKELKIHKELTFLDIKKQKIDIKDFKGNLILLNFWATWCTPCKKEMPSLDLLSKDKTFDNLKIFPINVGQDSVEKSQEFFKELNIKNLEIYFDSSNTLVRKLLLRGIPTTILLDKNGKEFGRIIGEIDFKDKKFIDFLSSYN